MFARANFGPSFNAGLLPGVPVRVGMGDTDLSAYFRTFVADDMPPPCRADQIPSDSGECFDTQPTGGIRTVAGPANMIDAPITTQLSSWFQANKIIAYGGSAVLLLLALSGGRRR